MRAAHADYYTALVRRDAARAARPPAGLDARRARSRAGEPPGRGPPPRLHRPPRRRRRLRVGSAHLLVDHGPLRRGAGVDARAARQGAADPAALPCDRVVLRPVGRDVAAAVSGGRRRPRPSACGCSPRAATRMPRRWRWRRGRRRACSCPTPTSTRRRASSTTRSSVCTASATAGARRSRAVVARPVSPGCAATATARSRTSSGRARSPTREATCSRARSPATRSARLLLVGGEVDEAEAVFRRTLVDSVKLHHEEGVAYGLEGLCAIAAAHGDARRAGALSAARPRRSGTASASSTSRRSRSTRCPSTPCARPTPRASRRASSKARR